MISLNRIQTLAVDRKGVGRETKRRQEKEKEGLVYWEMSLVVLRRTNTEALCAFDPIWQGIASL